MDVSPSVATEIEGGPLATLLGSSSHWSLPSLPSSQRRTKSLRPDAVQIPERQQRPNLGRHCRCSATSAATSFGVLTHGRELSDISPGLFPPQDRQP